MKINNELFNNVKSIQVERAILGSILYDYKNTLELVKNSIKPDDFYSNIHSVIYSIILDLHSKNYDIDTITVYDQVFKLNLIDKITSSTINDLVDTVDSISNLPTWIKLLKKASLSKKVMNLSFEITNDIQESKEPEEILALLQDKIFNLQSSIFGNKNLGISHLKDTFVDRVEAYKDARKNGYKLDNNKISTGYFKLDEMLSGGVGKGEFIIIAGRPAMGKTGIAVNIAENIALGVGQRDKENKKAVVIFSLEMTKESLVDRIIAGQIKLNSYQLRTGNFDSNIDEKLDTIVQKFNDTNFYCFDGGNLGINSIRNELRKLQAKEIEIGCIIIDYLQLMEEKDLNRNSNREQEISKLSRGLKLLSKELNTPVIALSQLSRNVEARANKRPQLSDLRESGSLEQDTDIVMFIYRDEYYNTESVKKGTAEVIVAKQRNGSVGTVELNFDSTLVKFNSLEEFGV